jgi:restriction system protein
MSFFLVKTYANEFIKALEGKIETEPVSHDETVDFVVADIEQTTRDFILKTLSQDFKGHPLAHLFGHLLEAMGYKVKVAPEGPDGGVDIIAHKDEFGFEAPIKVQVKSNDGNVGDPAVSALFGKLGKDDHGIIVTLGNFTKQAKDFSKSKTNLRLIDGEELVGLILSHYENLSAHYKSLIPLKRVYVPEPKTEDGE